MSAVTETQSAAAVGGAEVCAVCGADTSSGSFCRIFKQGRRVMLCRRQCAEVFLELGAARADANGDGYARNLSYDYH